MNHHFPEMKKCPNVSHLNAYRLVATHKPQVYDQCKNSGGFLNVLNAQNTGVWQIEKFLQHFPGICCAGCISGSLSRLRLNVVIVTQQ